MQCSCDVNHLQSAKQFFVAKGSIHKDMHTHTMVLHVYTLVYVSVCAHTKKMFERSRQLAEKVLFK